MSAYNDKINVLLSKWNNAPLRIRSMGRFIVARAGSDIADNEWGRDKTLQLIQYLMTTRHLQGVHKERIIDRLWDGMGTDKDFKVAMHGINKVLEPNRKNRADPTFVLRQGSTYRLASSLVAVDAEIMEGLIALGNESREENEVVAKRAYQEALKLHGGVYLPNRVYEDWSSEERERLQILALGAYITLAELVKNNNPMEAIRLCQHALEIDKTWEDAYRLIIEAFSITGNRPAALKTYQQCVDVLEEEFGIAPLPETRKIIEEIKRR